MTATTLKPQAMNATTRLASKILYSTRDMTAASGNVSYTGVGFAPTSIIAFSGVTSTPGFAVSMADSSKTVHSLANDNTAFDSRIGLNLFCLTYIQGGASYQYATIVSYDADGFTLAWTKSGTPTGTISLMFLCFQ